MIAATFAPLPASSWAMSFNPTMGNMPGTMLSTTPATKATSAPPSATRSAMAGFFCFGGAACSAAVTVGVLPLLRLKT